MGTTADKLAYLEGTKAAIREAISARGVELSESVPFREYAERIGEIGGSGGGLRQPAALRLADNAGAAGQRDVYPPPRP